MRFLPSKQTLQNLKAGTYYGAAISLFTFGVTYVTPFFYKTFCDHMGYTGRSATQKEYTPKTMLDVTKIHRKYKVTFNGATEPELGWSFFPLQESIEINPGETVLAFYRAYNHTDKPLIGISAYIVQPDDVVQYFHKIQCFCFDEQLLNPSEEVDLPIFFYLDPKIVDDSTLTEMKEMTLMYTFYKAQDQTLAELLEKHPWGKKELEERRARGITISAD